MAQKGTPVKKMKARVAKVKELKRSERTSKLFLNFTVAMDADDGSTVWFDCVAFDTVASNIANKVKKGDLVRLTGSASVREYVDKEGNNRTGNNLIVNELELPGGILIDAFTKVEQPKDEKEPF